MLEDHLTPWMQQWHCSPGFHSEQGIESIHDVFNNLERTFACITSSKEQMIKVLQEHHRQIHPENLAQQPVVPKKRKVQASQNETD